MKKSLFLSMLAAALMGGQVFADPTGTAIDNAGKIDGTNYYGVFSRSQSVSDGNVTIKADPNGEVSPTAVVWGGYTERSGMSASNNKVIMEGGKVGRIIGGQALASSTGGEASGNTVVMLGGQLIGIDLAVGKEANSNVAIITGGTINSTLRTTSSSAAVRVQNNKIHLLGKGVTATIADAQNNTATYTGSSNGVSIRTLSSGAAQNASGNSVDIYGTGITIDQIGSSPQILTFNIADEQVRPLPEVALTLTSTTSKYALNLTGVNLQIKDLDVTAWTPGTTITLVQSAQAIQGLSEPQEVEIKRGDVVTATATLKLNEDSTQLLLTNIQGSVPEPTTGTLSLLALAGLCARRRRK